MKLFDLFSKRQKRERGETIDIFTYDVVPQALRVQIIHIWSDAIGEHVPYGNDALEVYKTIHDALSREYGVFNLINSTSGRLDYEMVLKHFFLNCKENEKVLDAIELSFKVICARNYFDRLYVGISAQEAVNELNVRFLEHGVGYQFESGQLIRKDSEIIHKEAVKPVLNF